MLFFIQSHTKFKSFAKEEILNIFPKVKFEDLFDGNFLAKVNTSEEEMFNVCNNSIFVNNFFKVLFEDIKGLEVLIKKVVLKFEELDKNKTFRIETLTYNSDLNSRDIEVKLGTKIEELGYNVDFDSSDVIICVVSYKNRSLVGFIDSSKCLYKHINPAKRFSRENNKLNRAQSKLTEAIERFNLDLKKGIALDIGAAPGGWSKILSERGFNVYAVDPAKLDKSIEDIPIIIHVKDRIENFKPKTKFDIIVNDMNISPEDSARIMESLSKYLKKRGYALFTLKMTKKKPYLFFEKVERILESYEIIKIKHLFQNRQEVTILLIKK